MLMIDLHDSKCLQSLQTLDGYRGSFSFAPTETPTASFNPYRKAYIMAVDRAVDKRLTVCVFSVVAPALLRACAESVSRSELSSREP